MTYCDAMIKYADNSDWITHYFLIFLGIWKMWSLLAAAARWAEEKIHSDKESGK